MIFLDSIKLPKHRNSHLAQQVIKVAIAENFRPASKKVDQIVNMYRFKQEHSRQYSLLSNREIEVLKLFANGQTSPQIAEELFLSRLTIDTHRKNIKQKLGVKSLRDLMRYAFAFDLVEV